MKTVEDSMRSRAKRLQGQVLRKLSAIYLIDSPGQVSARFMQYGHMKGKVFFGIVSASDDSSPLLIYKVCFSTPTFPDPMKRMTTGLELQNSMTSFLMRA